MLKKAGILLLIAGITMSLLAGCSSGSKTDAATGNDAVNVKADGTKVEVGTNGVKVDADGTKIGLGENGLEIDVDETKQVSDKDAKKVDVNSTKNDSEKNNSNNKEAILAREYKKDLVPIIENAKIINSRSDEESCRATISIDKSLSEVSEYYSNVFKDAKRVEEYSQNGIYNIVGEKNGYKLDVRVTSNEDPSTKVYIYIDLLEEDTDDN